MLTRWNDPFERLWNGTPAVFSPTMLIHDVVKSLNETDRSYSYTVEIKSSAPTRKERLQEVVSALRSQADEFEKQLESIKDAVPESKGPNVKVLTNDRS